MNKKDSLAFLDECLNKLNNATEEDIATYKAAYEKSCSTYLISDSFDFCAPQCVIGKCERLLFPAISQKETIEVDYISNELKESIDYLLDKNEQTSDKEECLPFAA